MLSKSRGQVLRFAAALHVLFQLENEDIHTDEICETSLRAAINLIEVANEQTVIISGRETLEDEIRKSSTGDPLCCGKT